MRGTDAVLSENGYYKILETPYYNPNDEIWEFKPGSIVRTEEKVTHSGDKILYAVELIK